MRHLARIIVLWILIVSLPVQGFAAAIGLPCTMAHASAASAGAASVDDCDHADMRMPQAQAGGDSAHQGQPCDQGGDHKHASCRACTACCVGAAAPPPFAFAGLEVHRCATHGIPSVSSFAGWIPSRIERPPRV